MKINIRQAVSSDVKKIYKLLKPYADEGLILERKADDIARELDKFLVAEKKDGIAGVVSYYNYGNYLIEIRSLAVKKEFCRRGAGTSLLKFLIDSILIQFPGAKIFTLSYSPEFFQKNGFRPVDKETFPEKIWKDCRHCKDYDKCGETALVLSKKG